jgi:hypothetical protein
MLKQWMTNGLVIAVVALAAGCKPNTERVDGGPATLAAVDTSDPAATVRSFAAAVLSGDEAAARAAALEHPQSQKAAAAMARFAMAYAAFLDAVNASKFPTEDKTKLVVGDGQGEPIFQEIMRILRAARQGATVVGRPDANTAEVLLAEGGEPVIVRRVRGRWRVDLSTASDSEIEMDNRVADMLGPLTPRIRSGELKTEADVTNAMDVVRAKGHGN